MTYLPSLIKRIDEFYRQAAPYTYVSPDDADEPEDESEYGNQGGDNEDPLYSKIVSTLANFDNQSMADEVLVIAEEYKAALENKVRFSEVLKHIGNARVGVADMSNGPIDDQEEEISEDFLNELENTIRKLAVNAAPQQNNIPAVSNEAKKIRDDIKQRQAIEEMAGQKSVFEKGKPGENGGQSVGGKLFAPVTPEKYNAEISALQHYSSQLPAGSPLANNIDQLINKDKSILFQMKKVTDLKDSLVGLPEGKDKEDISALINSANEELSMMRKDRSKLKISLRQFEQENSRDELLKKIQNMPEGKEKEWLKLHAELAELRLKPKLYKRPVVKAIQKLIDATGTIDEHDDFISKTTRPEDLAKLKAKLREAEADLLNKNQYDRKLTQERGVQQGREITPTYDSYNYKENKITPGGRRVPMALLSTEEKISYEKMSFDKLVYQTQIDIASAVQGARQAVYESGTTDANKKKILYEDYKKEIENISKAIQDKNRQALYIGQKTLTDMVNKDLKVEQYVLNGYIKVIRLQPHFSKIVESIKKVTRKSVPPKLDPSGNLIPANFNEKDIIDIQYILNDISRLRSLYLNIYRSVSDIEQQTKTKPAKWWWEKKLVLPRFHKVVSDINKVQMRLNETLKVHAPKSGKKSDNVLNPEGSPFLKEISEKQKKLPPFSEREWELERLNKLKRKSMNFRKRVFKIVEGTNKLAGDIRKPERTLNPNYQSEYNRKRTEQLGIEQGRELVPKAPPQRGGPRQRAILDLELMSFSSLIEHLQHKINTGLGTVKDKLTKSGSSGEFYLKTYVDAISTAIEKHDNEAKYKAIRELKAIVDNALDKNQNLKALIKLARLVPHFRALKDDLKKLSKKPDSYSELHVSKLIDRSKRLQQICLKYNGADNINLGLNPILGVLEVITRRLQEEDYKKENKND